MSSTRILSLAIIALAGLVNVSDTQAITSDTFFYGQSPPVYPSRTSKLLPTSSKS